MTPTGTRPAQRAVHLTVSGRVQGVGFRWFVLEEAEAAGVSGWVKNLDDGRVEAWIEGDAEAVRTVEEAVTRGPRHARVTGVERREERPTGRYREFGVEP
jgi:acylphosphatase